MARRHAAVKRSILPDPKFGSEMIAKFINMLMLNGKKSVAEKVVYGALDTIGEKAKGDAMEVLQSALDNVQRSASNDFHRGISVHAVRCTLHGSDSSAYHTSDNNLTAFPPTALAMSSSEYPCFTSHRSTLNELSVGFSTPRTYSTFSCGGFFDAAADVCDSLIERAAE